MSRTPAAQKPVDLKPLAELAALWGLPEDLIIRECKPLLHLPEEAALAVMREEPPRKAPGRGRNMRREVSRG